MTQKSWDIITVIGAYILLGIIAVIAFSGCASYYPYQSPPSFSETYVKYNPSTKKILSKVEVKDSAGTVAVHKIDYEYNVAGNLVSLAEANYSYDSPTYYTYYNYAYNNNYKQVSGYGYQPHNNYGNYGYSSGWSGGRGSVTVQTGVRFYPHRRSR